MPRIHLIFNSKSVEATMLSAGLPDILTRLTVEHLSIEGNKNASFTKNQVEVIIRSVNQQNSLNMPPVSVTIDANYFHERHENLQERTKAFREKLENFLKEKTTLSNSANLCGLWIRLLPAGYEEFQF